MSSIRIPVFTFFAALLLASCVDDSPNPVVFDQTIESVSFENRLFAPIIIYRNNEVVDTLGSRESASYRIDAKGAFRHEWGLFAPRNNLGDRIGLEGRNDLGLQYEVNGSYTIRNVFQGQPIFTPRILNLSIETVQWTWTNFQAASPVRVNRSILANTVTDLDHAPYFVWSASSNVVVEDPSRLRLYHFSRRDTIDGRPELDLDDDFQFSGSGVTIPLEIR